MPPYGVSLTAKLRVAVSRCYTVSKIPQTRYRTKPIERATDPEY